MSSDNDARGNGSDIWIAVGVVLCLAIGASMTYWLTSDAGTGPKRPAQAEAGAASGAAEGGSGLQGELMNAPVEKKADSIAIALIPAAENAEYPPVNFDTLASFYYEIPAARPRDPAALRPEATRPEGQHPDQIPAPIKALDGKKAAVQGFMYPLKLEKGAAKVFLLVQDTSLCCFGRMPRMNQWVSVKMGEGRSAKFIGDQPVTVFGVLGVGEEINENGEVLSIYRLDADDVAGPLDL